MVSFSTRINIWLWPVREDNNMSHDDDDSDDDD